MLIKEFTDGSRPIPPWKKFFHVSENKQNLIHYLCHCLTAACEELLHNGIEKARDLFTSHKESDSKMIISHAVSSDKVLRNQIEMGV